MSDSVLDISSEKISEPASIVKGVSSPKLLAIPILKKTKAKLEGQNSRMVQKKNSLCAEFVPLTLKLYLREGSFTSTWLSTNEDGSASNLAFPDHAQNDTCRSSGINL